MDEREEKLYGKDPGGWPSGDVPGDTGAGVIGRHSDYDITKPFGKRDFLKSNLDLLRFAKDTKRDLVAFSKGREVKILIGAGIATAGIVGGITLYKYRQKNRK